MLFQAALLINKNYVLGSRIYSLSEGIFRKVHELNSVRGKEKNKISVVQKNKIRNMSYTK